MMEDVEALKKRLNQYQTLLNITNHWLLLKQQNKSIEGYFIDNNYKQVAIYGMKEIGFRLYADIMSMKETRVSFLCDDSDIKLKTLFPNEIVNPENWGETKTDVIVVTAAFEYEKIRYELSKKTDIPIVSIEDVVFYTYENPLFRYGE